jgi:hypothetical protein
MNERYKGIWDRIKIWIKIVKNPNAFINGLQRNWNEILMTRSQVEEIVEILETEGYIATSPDSETTSTTVKLDDYTISNFDANGVLFGKETDSETYILAIHLREEDDYWSFTKGDNCNCISAQEVGDFLYSIKQLIGDSNANM